MNSPFIHKESIESCNTKGYKTYRIPGIVVTAKDTILAYYEARTADDDWGKSDIFLRRKPSGTNIWEEHRQIVCAESGQTVHNPVMIVEDSNDRIHFLYNTDYNRCFYKTSSNDGVTWSDAQEITEVFEGFRREYDWNVIAVGPGHGIQLKSGRLFVPVWLSNGGLRKRPSVLSCIYSDNGGNTWERGEIIWDKDGLINPNETCAVELDKGAVLLNIRHETNKSNPQEQFRAVSVSLDGKTNWSKPRFDYCLIDPICMDSILRFTWPDIHSKSRIIFSNCAAARQENGKGRVNLTVRLSTDECKTWSYSKIIEARSGYSDLAVSCDKRKIYCIYENDWSGERGFNIKNLTVATMNIEWLTDGEDFI